MHVTNEMRKFLASQTDDELRAGIRDHGDCQLANLLKAELVSRK